MEKRVYNFSAGPAVLPEEVLKEAQENFYSYPGVGISVMEMSHRSKAYDNIITAAENDFRQLLDIGDDYHVLFLQGGATLQFSMVPLNIMGPNYKADYIVSGSWAKKAVKEAKRVGQVNIAATTESDNFTHLPKQEDLKLDPQASYVHYTSNNTIFGTQYITEPEVGEVPLVCDASSDILHKKIDVKKYGLIYAGAQKNMGPAGCTIVIVRKDLLERAPDDLHTYMNFNTHAGKASMYNTPPTFTIYIMGLVFKWLKNMGGLDAMYKLNKEKAGLLYDYIDNSGGYYKGTVTEKSDRSLMNVTFRMPTEELEKKFIAESTEKGFSGLKGHRSVGGLRASIYNAFPKKGVEDLVEFMKEFKNNN
ncbi:MAG: 3-phosphoserine/phosphohydroxythreonine transaminase [Melioribacteraceae bacterium]|nr:3-phosphoserine/phosphohydroxythreonine transaminase [Melioribacteraceae bacterium]MCF8356732.1 3-phosphoserine/phosphohydroxythreonine transaminase [Melioribacteraceae bacterium]MCF8396086.1 3-phosphoserine/phosphohydroxythreonine transaminase [Melioribacteraceae bacterium]MCF8421072.1 3-phosphoserine/phosphohydroxythreonine transaminase [Melioribacteraceae bacterium]